MDIDREQIINRIARLESINDYLQSELLQVDQQLRLIGFASGTEEIRKAARELLSLDQGDLT